MPKLGIFSGEEVCRILEAEGFTRVRQRGSHIVMQRRTAQGSTTVPVLTHKTIRIGTLRAIIRPIGGGQEFSINAGRSLNINLSLLFLTS